MIPRVTCRSCGNELNLHNAFCSKCGEKIEWAVLQSPAVMLPSEKPPRSSGEGQRCPLCGHENPSGATDCISCGAQVGKLSSSNQTAQQKARNGSAPAAKHPPLKTLQSWKVTVGLGFLLVVIIVLMRLSRSNESSPSVPAVSPNTAEMMKRIETLQKVVDANPKEAAATLELANLLHDVKSLPQSVMMYRRFLDMNPSNADARVDLGISYFELSISDSSRRDEFLEAAKKEMEHALNYAPKHQLAHFNLGVVCLHAGDAAKAVDWFKKCIAIDPNSETGRRAQQLINQHSFNTPSQ